VKLENVGGLIPAEKPEENVTYREAI